MKKVIEFLIRFMAILAVIKVIERVIWFGYNKYSES